MIIFNQAHSEKVEYLFHELEIRGYTLWENVQGRGSNAGLPHLGTHAWPEINKSILAVVEDMIVDQVLNNLRKIDEINPDIGLRAFVWDIYKTI